MGMNPFSGPIANTSLYEIQLKFHTKARRFYVEEFDFRFWRRRRFRSCKFFGHDAPLAPRVGFEIAPGRGVLEPVIHHPGPGPTHTTREG